MKLLYIINRLSQGGISTVLINRLNFLAKDNAFEIHVLTESENDSEIEKQFSAAITFHVIKISSFSQKKRLPFFGFFQLQKELKDAFQNFIDDLAPDFITTFNVDAVNNTIIPHIKTSAVKVIEFHGAYKSRTYLIDKGILKKEPWQSKIKLYLNNPVNIFAIPSAQQHNSYDYGIVLTKEDKVAREKDLKLKIKHIYNFMHVEENVVPFSSRDNIIIGVGRMVQQKNLLDLVEAVNIIKDFFVDWKVEIYGDGEEFNLIKDRIDQYGLEQIIKLKGFCYNMSAVYNNSKLLVTPALWEGQPMNILEAFGFSIPVISYNCKSGPKEIIRDGVNGYLVDFNTIHLAEKIKELITDENLLRKFSQNTFLDLDKFSFDKTMNEWKLFYKQQYKNRQDSKGLQMKK